MKTLFTTITMIAAANPAGFTINLTDMQPATDGYAVAIAETQNSFGVDGLNSVIQYAANNGKINAVGGWLDSATGLYYYDAVIVCKSRETAARLGRINKQIAIFDLSNKIEIRL